MDDGKFRSRIKPSTFTIKYFQATLDKLTPENCQAVALGIQAGLSFGCNQHEQLSDDHFAAKRKSKQAGADSKYAEQHNIVRKLRRQHPTADSDELTEIAMKELRRLQLATDHPVKFRKNIVRPLANKLCGHLPPKKKKGIAAERAVFHLAFVLTDKGSVDLFDVAFIDDKEFAFKVVKHWLECQIAANSWREAP